MKQKIKSIAIQLFYQKGYHACSISNIAERAGIQKSSIYYHYMNKEELLFDILKETMDDLNKMLQEVIHKTDDTEQQMKAIIQNHLKFHMERQKEVIIADSELRGLTADNLRAIIRMRDNYDNRIKEIIKKGIDEGIFINRDPRVVSNAIVTMCSQTSTWFNPLGSLSRDEIVDIYTMIIFDGLMVKK